MDITMLYHPMVVQTVEALVADGGGLISYDQGMGGRETLVAAAAALAARNRSALTIVEAPVLHDDINATVARLHPGVQCTVISAQDAARQPMPAPRSVLAVHADLLRDPTVRQPVLELARAVDHLLVARHDYSDPTLDSLAGPTHRLDYQAYVSAANESFKGLAQQFAPAGYVPPPMEQREGRVARQGTAESPSTDMWARDLERKRHLIDQLNQRRSNQPPPDSAYVDLADLDAAPHADIDFNQLAAEEKERIAAAADAAEQRAAELRDRLREGALDRAAATHQPHTPHQHDRAQDAARQHDIPGGRTPGQ